MECAVVDPETDGRIGCVGEIGVMNLNPQIGDYASLGTAGVWDRDHTAFDFQQVKVCFTQPCESRILSST
jgi:hypothetical protein